MGVDEVAREVSSVFNVWYLGEATLDDSPSKVLEDMQHIVDKLNSIGLEINSDKCEFTFLSLTSLEEGNIEASFREVHRM